MQINERVWRGFYRIESLRWNIRYNIRAGGEILDLYLREYAIKRSQSKGTLDSDTLVQVTYVMYNAGPGEYFRFLNGAKRTLLIGWTDSSGKSTYHPREISSTDCYIASLENNPFLISRFRNLKLQGPLFPGGQSSGL